MTSFLVTPFLVHHNNESTLKREAGSTWKSFRDSQAHNTLAQDSQETSINPSGGSAPRDLVISH